MDTARVLPLRSPRSSPFLFQESVFFWIWDWFWDLNEQGKNEEEEDKAAEDFQGWLICLEIISGFDDEDPNGKGLISEDQRG